MNKVIYEDISVKDLKFLMGEEKVMAKRSLREPLLKAFDIYKSNVAYGVVVESEEENEKIKKWYNSLLDLNESALKVIPSGIKKYL
ncbi:MAG: hypothetical protein IJY57_00435 [Clostridia bacterium]|nr:hypothetical protein [Clostridia bacterium]